MNVPAPLSITLARAHRKSRNDDLETSLAEAAHIARKEIIAEIYRGASGSPARTLSPVDLVACLYGAELNLWPSSIEDPDRDRLVVSLPDATPAVRAVARHYGFQSIERPGDPAAQLERAGATSGPSRFGLSLAVGMAVGLKLKQSPARIYALLGEHELTGGAMWESALIASGRKLDNLCAIVEIAAAKPREIARDPVAARWRAFDWAVTEIDGHDFAQILSAFRRTGSVRERPAAILAHTSSARGVPAWENSPQGIGTYGLTLRQAEEALAALGASSKEVRNTLDVKP